MVDSEPTEVQPKSSVATLAVFAAAAAILHFGADIFLPLAIATLITFALSPAVDFLRRRGLPQIATVLLVVTLAFIAIALFLIVIATEMSQLAGNLPTFQANIMTKLDAFEKAQSQSGIFPRITDLMSAINEKIAAVAPAATEAGKSGGSPPPVTVEVVEHKSPLATLTNFILPLLSPVATAGLVIVVVIFMLLESDELRDRFIRLVGAKDLHRSTEMMADAGSRVANYLLMQLLVNVIYAVPIGAGLWLIGVPNAVLWALLTLVLRFVPYIGSALAAGFPLFLAFAASPDWSMVLWTAALFIVVELVTSNVIEPWLYGSHTGLTPLAIIVSAIVWTWIWGPAGLVLSTPLTVCLVVLGRYLPQFAVFNILFGDEPALSPSARLYQRLLVGDVTGSAARAEEELENIYLADYHRDTGIPALLLAQRDLDRGVLSPAQEERLAESASAFLEDMAGTIDSELAEQADPDDDTTRPALEGDGFRVLSVGGHRRLDDIAAVMLAQSLMSDGATATALSYRDLTVARFASVAGNDASCVILNFLDPAPSRASLLHIRRIKRAAPHMRVGVLIWQMSTDQLESAGLEPHRHAVSPEKLREAEEIGADFAVTGSEEARAAAYSDAPPKRPAAASRRRARTPLRKVAA